MRRLKTNEAMQPIIIAVAAAIAGMGLGYVLAVLLKRKQHQSVLADIAARRKELERKAREVEDAARLKAQQYRKEKELELKEKFLQLKSRLEQQQAEKNKKIQERFLKVKDLEQRIRRDQEAFKKLKAEVEEAARRVEAEKKKLAARKEQLEAEQATLAEKLEKIANYTVEEARREIMERVKQEAEKRAMAEVHERLEEIRLTAREEATKIVLSSIGRIATEATIENVVSVVPIDSDEIKGRVIGREGRNIRAFEAVTGVDLLIDDSPGVLVLSSFDQYRREIARIALQRLLKDGRIHPARIEEMVAKVKKELDDRIMEIGQRTIRDLGIHKMHRKLIRLVGRMRFRTSYGQNLLHHSREVARLCAAMAADLGLNPAKAKRAGLLHDIGKVSDEDPDLSHALLGARLAERYGEDPEVVNAIASHHDEVEKTTLLAPIVQVCDAISGARPGARRESYDAYVQRLQDLEKIAASFEGVEKAFAIHAGREVRVFVKSQKVSDAETELIAHKISDTIQEKLTYPGQVKVTVIREKRASAVAR